MTFLAIAIAGTISFINIPLSLMPETETPQLRVEVAVPDGSPMYIEQSVLTHLRAACQGLLGIKEVESMAASANGQVLLTFEYGTDMKQAYIEANEKIDQSLRFLPKDLDRPIVRRVLQTDIPVVRLQVNSDVIPLLDLTQLARNVVKRRLEQLKGVSLVEWNGGVKEVIRVIPDRIAMSRYDITESQLTRAIASSNTQIAQIKVNEGLYQYDLTFENLLEDPSNLEQLVVFERSGRPVPLADLATIKSDVSKPLGSHWFNGAKGIVFAVHKRESADFNQLDALIGQVIAQMRQDFPDVNFHTTQSQSQLLNNSITQLTTSLVLGIVLASLILFLFSSDWRSSLLMILLIPMAMLISLGVLHVFGLSLNIITLSGMILGVGILIDNGIILIDNIRAKALSNDLLTACIKGTSEIVPALISSAGTTLCVFIPLIFLEGVGGSLFKQQAFTFGVVLVSSLVVTFFLLPLLYLKVHPSGNPDNKLFAAVKQLYLKGQNATIEKIFLLLFIVIAGFGAISYQNLPQSPLPEIKTQDAQIALTWGDVMTLQAQEEAIENWVKSLQGIVAWEADIGKNDIYEDGIPGIEKALIYFQFDTYQSRETGLKQIQQEILEDFPQSNLNISRAKNPYDQLLGQKEPFAVFEMRTAEKRLIQDSEIAALLDEHLQKGLSFQSQQGFEITFDQNRLNAFGLSQSQLIDPLKIQFGDFLITTVNLVNQSIPIVIRGNEKLERPEMEQIRIPVNDSVSYPISHFINIQKTQTNRYITADEAGVYQALEIADQHSDLPILIQKARAFANEKGWLLSVQGSFQKVEENLKYLVLSFSIVILLLFSILAAQFESLKKPLIILAEVPISLSGSLLFLYLFNQSLNLSSMMGIIIMLGIIVNDSILKVDSINRYIREGTPRDLAIQQAGQDRLKPILMTTLTTILALLPILWSTGLGSDIQIPLCIAVIGGLFVGTICSIYLVPILYRWLTPS